MTGTTTTPHDDLPAAWRRAAISVASARTALLDGLPGTGKSYLATRMSDHPSGQVLDVDCDVFNLTLHDDATTGDVVGNYLPRAGRWDWRDGPCVTAWRLSHERPVRVVLNEVDQAAGAVLTALYAIMDSPDSAVLTLPTGETIRPHVEWRADGTPWSNLQVVSTMNGTASDLPLALADRHVAKVTVNTPHPDSIARLPREWQDTARGMTEESARREGRGTSVRDWHGLNELCGAGLSLADAASLIWSESKAREIHDHLQIAGASMAPRIKPKAASKPRAAKVNQGAASGPEFKCPHSDHTFDAGEVEGTFYPNADDEVWCHECADFHTADECRVSA